MATKKVPRKQRFAHIPRLYLIAGAAVALALLATAAYMLLTSKPVNQTQTQSPTTQTMSPTTEPSGTQPNAQPETAPSPAPVPKPSVTQAKPSVSIVGLSAHIRSYTGYELTVSAGSDLTEPGTCTITATKSGSQTITYTAATSPDSSKPNGYPTWCNYIKLLALRDNSGHWDYYVDPGTWTVTVKITANGATGSANKTIDVQKFN